MPRGKTDKELFELGQRMGQEMNATIYKAPNELGM